MGQKLLDIALPQLPAGALQGGQLALHLARRVQHQGHTGKGLGEQAFGLLLFGLQGLLFLPCQCVQAHQPAGHQHGQPPTGGPPGGGMGQLQPGIAQALAPAGPCRQPQVELRGVPAALGTGQQPLGRGVDAKRVAHRRFGQCGTGGFGQAWRAFGQWQTHGHLSQGLGEHAQGAVVHQPGLAVLHQGVLPRLGLGRQVGHDARHRAARCLQGRQVGVQGGFVAGHDPGGLARLPAGLQGQVQAGGVGQQAVFQQAVQRLAQAGGVDFGGLHAVPRGGAHGQHQHHGVVVGQQGGHVLPVGVGGLAVVAVGPGPFGGGGVGALGPHQGLHHQHGRAPATAGRVRGGRAVGRGTVVGGWGRVIVGRGYYRRFPRVGGLGPRCVPATG